MSKHKNVGHAASIHSPRFAPISRRLEIFIFATAVGLMATFAAPWFELRGSFAAWTLVEWHTFWRGSGSFQLSGVVASGYPVPVEFATSTMQSSVHTLILLGAALGAWHALALLLLLAAGIRLRLRARVSLWRAAFEFVGLAALNVAVLYVLSVLLALPSSLNYRVDFRSPSDVHTSTLIWSGLTLLPIGLALSLVAGLVQVSVFLAILLGRVRPRLQMWRSGF